MNQDEIYYEDAFGSFWRRDDSGDEFKVVLRVDGLGFSKVEDLDFNYEKLRSMGYSSTSWDLGLLKWVKRDLNKPLSLTSFQAKVKDFFEDVGCNKIFRSKYFDDDLVIDFLDYYVLVDSLVFGGRLGVYLKPKKREGFEQFVGTIDFETKELIIREGSLSVVYKFVNDFSNLGFVVHDVSKNYIVETLEKMIGRISAEFEELRKVGLDSENLGIQSTYESLKSCFDNVAFAIKSELSL